MKNIVAMLVMTGALAVTTPACKGPVFPVIDGIANVVAVDLAEGKTDEQIASDVCQFLGGTSSTDAACGNVEALIQDAITLLIDTGVLKGKALENGKAYQTRRAQAPAPASK